MHNGNHHFGDGGHGVRWQSVRDEGSPCASLGQTNAPRTHRPTALRIRLRRRRGHTQHSTRSDGRTRRQNGRKSASGDVAQSIRQWLSTSASLLSSFVERIKGNRRKRK